MFVCALVVVYTKLRLLRSLTVLVGAHSVCRAAGPVPWRGEAQHGGVVLGELLQARDVAHVHTVLEVGPHRHHGNVVLVARLPCQELTRQERPNTNNKINQTGFHFPKKYIVSQTMLATLLGAMQLRDSSQLSVLTGQQEWCLETGP